MFVRVFHNGTFLLDRLQNPQIVALWPKKLTDFFGEWILEVIFIAEKNQEKKSGLILAKIEIAQISTYYPPIDAEFHADFKNV